MVDDDVNGQRRCAYCGRARTLTREHLWPGALHARVAAAWGTKSYKNFWLARLQKEISSEPVIKDVCAECNNGPLSRLDGYICELFDRYFLTIPNKGDSVLFKYDFHPLTRWLLKMSYNSSRMNDGIDQFVFVPLRNYILGHSMENWESVRVFLELAYPARIPRGDLSDDFSEATLFYPEANRMGHQWFKCALGEKLLRTVHLRAFSFSVAFFDPVAQQDLRKLTTAAYLGKRRKAVWLRPEAGRIYVKCGLNAWESFRDARGSVVGSVH
jgi:hypothetical protein